MKKLNQLRYALLTACFFFYFFLNAQPTSQLIGVGQNSQIKVTSSNTQPGTNEANTLSSEGFLPNNNAASRFLSQATFGPTFNEIIALSDLGFEDWLDQQFNMVKAFNSVDKVAQITAIKNAGLNDPENLGPHFHFWDYTYWEYALTSPDVLRQRIALALSEILVISQNSSLAGSAYAFANYYDLLLDNAFGNYRDILEAVTFQSSMGVYLTYMNNPKQDTTYEINYDVWPFDTLSQQVLFPDENYAREVMQLFTIGLCELNIDGSCKTDQNGIPIPTYDNVDIAEFAKIFTGLSWGDAMGFGYGPGNFLTTFSIPMNMYNEYHDPGTKNLLKGQVVQPRNPVDGVADIQEALDNLFNHPNVGPFIGKLFIQRLVTSNPSPAYIERVARAFNGESHYSNQRGDMKAFIKAILLDEEARSCAAQAEVHFGMLREPFVRYVQLCRSFNLSAPNNVYRNAMHSIRQYFGQKPFASPSVFNFFQSDYQPIGPIEEAGLVAPEFQITNSQSIAGYMNALNRWTIYEQLVDDWGRGFDEPYDPNNEPSLDLSAEVLLIEEERLPELIDRLNLILAHGQISQNSKILIISLLKEMSIIGWNEENTIFLKLQRVRMAIFLIMSNPEYLVNR